MDGGARPLDGTFALSTRFEYFQARWQTNGLLFRRLGGLGDVTNLSVAAELVSISGHEHALVEPPGRLTTWDDRDPSIAGKAVSIFYTSQFMLEPLRRVVNMGIMYAGFGKVEWAGNHFRTEAELDHEHIVITGQLLPAPGGRPSGLKVHYAFPHQTYHYIIRYSYAPTPKYSYLPAVIRSCWIPDDRKQTEIEVDEWRIINFEIDDTLLADNAFGIAPFAQFNRWATRVYPNGAVYDRGTNGALQMAYILDPFGALLPPRPRISRMLLYTIWGGMNVAIFALVLGAKEPNKENSKHERRVTA